PLLPGLRKVRMKNIAPGLQQQLVSVRVLLGELQVASANILDRLGSEEKFVELHSEALRQGRAQSFLVAKSFVDGGSGGTGILGNRAQRESRGTARSPQFLRASEYFFFQV